MNMKKRLLYIGICLLAFVCNACSDEAESIEAVDTNKVELQLQLALPVNEASRAKVTTEAGTAYENYINFNEEKNYRIYFFDTGNKYIARFTPSKVVMTEANDYVLYSVQGTVPKELIPQSGTKNFKIVVLGNWSKYEEPTSEIMLEELCNAEWAQFEYLKTFELSETNLIPFYGVHEYEDISFQYGEITTLKESITLLRAMAKVEVVLKTEGMSFSSVSIQGYNQEGYCAPSDVDSQEDYDYDADQPTLHLIGDKNDEDAASRSLSFLHIEGEDNDTWIAYLPEYKNVGDKDLAAHIEVRFDIQTEDDENDFIIYFSDDQDDKSKTFDIVRNNLYRFNVTIDPKGKLAVEVNKWDEIFENNFIF